MTKKILLIVSLLFVSIAYSQEKWTLKKCVEYALENNISIKQNALNISLSERDVAITQGNFLPSINASSSGGINSGLSPDSKLPEIIELKNHPWFVAVQFHPEFRSRPLAPHPLFSSFIKAAKNH